MGDWPSIPLLVAAATGAGLIGGLFFAFSNFIMRALARLPGAHGMAAMQSINVTVVNPAFLLVFFGTGGAALWLAISAIRSWGERGTGMALAAAAAYLIGSIGVTVACNVPMNDRLARSPADDASVASHWRPYVDRWTHWNHVRTVLSLVAAVLFAAAAATAVSPVG